MNEAPRPNHNVARFLEWVQAVEVIDRDGDSGVGFVGWTSYSFALQAVDRLDQSV
jgi:hypothetical protein